MTSRDFAFWLQGFFEISGTDEINKEQVIIIKKHLNLVFKHEIDPSMGDQKHQDELNEIHNDIPSFIKQRPESNGPTVLRC
jgi:hypothetical protein